MRELAAEGDWTEFDAAVTLIRDVGEGKLVMEESLEMLGPFVPQEQRMEEVGESGITRMISEIDKCDEGSASEMSEDGDEDSKYEAW